jgi:hypothetical protein
VKNRDHILFKAAIENNYLMLKNCPKQFTPEECNLKNEEENTPLFYSVTRNNS